MRRIRYPVFVEQVRALSCLVKKDKSVKNLFGIPRGGLVVAVFLSHVLILPLASAPNPNETLVVDDIADSGKTLQVWKLAGFKTAVLQYKKERSVVKPDFFVEVIGDVWQEYPWERS